MPLETIANDRANDLETYVWEVPGAPVRVHLQLGVLESIDAYIRQTRPGVHTPAPQRSGIFLGSLKTPREPRITNFRPVNSLTSSDITAALSSIRRGESGEEPLGYFRTHSESRLGLAASDIAIAERFFSDPDCIFLLVNYRRTGSAKAGFFFWDDSYLNADFCFLEFPFSVSSLSLDAPKTTPAGSHQTNGKAPDARQILRSHAPNVWKSTSSEPRPIGPSTQTGAPDRDPIQPEEHPPEEAGPSTSDTEVRPKLIRSFVKGRGEAAGWTQTRLTIAIAAAFFVLSTGGSYMYLRAGLAHDSFGNRIPKSAPAKAVRPGGQSITHRTVTDRSIGPGTIQPVSAKVLTASAAPKPAAAREAEATGTPEISRSAARTKPDERGAAGRNEQASVQKRFHVDTALVAHVPSGRTLVSASPISLNLANTNIADPPPFSALMPSVPPPPAQTPPAGKRTQALPAVVPEPEQTYKMAPVKASAPSYQAPRPTKRVIPSVSSLGAPSNSPIPELSVEVSIDQNGNVTSAKLADDQPKMSRLMIYSVLQAAHQWKFEPAKLEGKVVPANHVIVFRFRDSGK